MADKNEILKQLEKENETLKKDLFLALVIIAGEFPAHDDNYKSAKVMAERHNLGDIDPA